jgi:DNA-binding CsgD family transcriptional regulator
MEVASQWGVSRRTVHRWLARYEAEGLEGLPNGIWEPREIKVVKLLADGLHTAEVGRRVFLSDRTVKNIIHGVNSRLNLGNRTQVVTYALRNGLIYVSSGLPQAAGAWSGIVTITDNAGYPAGQPERRRDLKCQHRALPQRGKETGEGAV